MTSKLPVHSQERPPGLIQRYREELQVRHYARRTIKTYEQWLRRFLHFHARRHPRQMGLAEVEAYLTWTLAVLNDEKLDGDKLLTEEIAEDGFNAMRFLPDVVTSAIETTLARVYDVDPEELSALLYPEE